MGTPTLIVISGPPGAGKTTLAHGLSARIGCPAICRDEIKEGMVHALGVTPGPDEHDPLNWRVLDVFFSVLQTLVRAEVTTIAEAAYQDRLWRGGLTPLLTSARLLLIRCRVDADLARRRHRDRLDTDPRRAAHADAALLSGPEPPPFDWLRLDVPTLDLDTSAEPSRTVATAADFASRYAHSAGGAR